MRSNGIDAAGIGQIKPADYAGKPGQAEKSAKLEFKNQLNRFLDSPGGIKFSGHAAERLADRGVEMTQDKAIRLIKAVDAAQEKGSKESLVLLDELAFVVSVKNRTVITACDTQGIKEGVFTKIDSAVLG